MLKRNIKSQAVGKADPEMAQFQADLLHFTYRLKQIGLELIQKWLSSRPICFSRYVK